MPRRSERQLLEDHFKSYEEGFNAGIRYCAEQTGQEEYFSGPTIRAGPPPRRLKKKARRKTAYQSAYSAAYKRLKKKHPRMSFGSLSKKAHAAARKKVK